MEDDKEIRWVGSAYDDLVDFPAAPRRDAGFQLGKVQVTARYRAVVNARRARP